MQWKNLLSRWLLVDLIRGFKITLRAFLSPPVTVLYPEQEIPKSPRFRGLHALRRDENGDERCIGCQLCEVVCPAVAITIQPAEREDGRRYAERYEIDLFKCVYCGLCEQSCPVGAIVQTTESHYVFYNQGDQIMDKPLLLALGDHYEPQLKANKDADLKVIEEN